MTPTDAAQDVIENALSVLDQGFDLSYMAEMPGLTELGDDEDGRMYFALGGLPLMIDCDEETCRVQWIGGRAEACYDGFLSLFSEYDPDTRRTAVAQGGHFGGTIRIGGRAITFALYDDSVVLGDDASEAFDGTVLTLEDAEASWTESRRSFG